MIRRLIALAIYVCLFGRGTAGAQSVASQPLSITPFPVGLQPLGVALIGVPRESITMPLYTVPFAVVGNSGDNSVSILELSLATSTTFKLTPSSVLTGVPSPYDVADCPVRSTGLGLPYSAFVLVTSPSENSVRALRLSWSGFTGEVKIVPTGPQPYAWRFDVPGWRRPEFQLHDEPVGVPSGRRH
jgi:hypothetical protein